MLWWQAAPRSQWLMTKTRFSLMLHFRCWGFAPCHFYCVTEVEGAGSSCDMPVKGKERILFQRGTQHLSSHVFAKASHVATPAFKKVGSRKGYYKSHGHIWYQCSGRCNLPTERVSDILNINAIYPSFYQVLL